jgi:hypothetical protein
MGDDALSALVRVFRTFFNFKTLSDARKQVISK